MEPVKGGKLIRLPKKAQDTLVDALHAEQTQATPSASLQALTMS